MSSRCWRGSTASSRRGGRPEARGRALEVELSLRAIADDVGGRVVADSGPIVPEEQPVVLAQRPQAFLAQSQREGRAPRRP